MTQTQDTPTCPCRWSPCADHDTLADDKLRTFAWPALVTRVGSDTQCEPVDTVPAAELHAFALAHSWPTSEIQAAEELASMFRRALAGVS
jgi:hypothetical protein